MADVQSRFVVYRELRREKSLHRIVHAWSHHSRWRGLADDAKIFRAGAAEVDVTPTTFPVIVSGGFTHAQPMWPTTA